MIRILSRWRMGSEISALMIATGVAWRKLDMPALRSRRWRILRCSAERSDRL